MKTRLHIENSSKSSSLSHITEAQVRAAIQRHQPLAQDLEVTVGWDSDILDTVLPTVDFMIASRPPRESLGRRAPKLRWIQTTGAGIDHLLPLDWLPREITLTNNSGPHGARAEDFCIMALLALSACLPQLIAQQNERTWSSIFTTPIRGRSCVIVGFGDIGQAAGRACERLGLDVVAVTRTGKGSGPAAKIVPASQIDDVLPTADYLIITAPLTPQTRNLINRTRLAKLRKTAGVINVSRAPIVDYVALAELLNGGRLAGAILDVHNPEPLPSDSPLWTTRNLIVTPHISCDDPRYVEMLLDAWFRNLARLVAGQSLANIVDREQGY